MATVTNFEDLDIWKLSRDLCNQIYQLTETEKFRKDKGLVQQMLNSSGSVMDNIAEGFERNGNREFIQALFISKGSLGELRSQIIRSFDRKFISQEDLMKYNQLVNHLGSKTWNLISYLQNSTLKGIKFTKR